MISYSYQLIAPKIITPKLTPLTLSEDSVLIRPRYMAICHADQRYYRGLRSAEILKKKLPMALIHEACGEVVHDPKGVFAPGEQVVMIPNIPGRESDYVAENYQKGSGFRASGIDGFMQEFVLLPHDRVVSAQKAFDPAVLSITEFVSVAVHTVSRFLKKRVTPADTVGLWGDGCLGYVTANVLRLMAPEAKLMIVGLSTDKLNLFSFAHKTYLNTELPADFSVDHAFEITGGGGCEFAMDDIIRYIAPEGTVMLMGVSENKVPVMTRDVLEKGLTLVGSSRSGRQDFLEAVRLMEQPDFAKRLRLIISDVMKITSIRDIEHAFERDAVSPYKTVLDWRL